MSNAHKKKINKNGASKSDEIRSRRLFVGLARIITIICPLINSWNNNALLNYRITGHPNFYRQK